MPQTSYYYCLLKYHFKINLYFSLLAINNSSNEINFELERIEDKDDDVMDLRFSIEELHGNNIFIRKVSIPTTIKVIFLFKQGHIEERESISIL